MGLDWLDTMFVLIWRGGNIPKIHFSVFGFVLKNTFLCRIPKYRQQLNLMCPPSLCVWWEQSLKTRKFPQSSTLKTSTSSSSPTATSWRATWMVWSDRRSRKPRRQLSRILAVPLLSTYLIQTEPAASAVITPQICGASDFLKSGVRKLLSVKAPCSSGHFGSFMCVISFVIKLISFAFFINRNTFPLILSFH